MTESKIISESAELLNQLIRESQMVAIGTTGSAGGPGQRIAVTFEHLGSVQAICGDAVVPGKVEGRKTDRGWIVRSMSQARTLTSQRQLRRGREVAIGQLSFAFIYRVNGQLYLGGLFSRKAIDHPLATLPVSGASIHHKGSKLLAIAKIGNSLLSLRQSGEPTVFTDSRVLQLNPVGGGVWVGESSRSDPAVTSSRETESSQRFVVERAGAIDFFDADFAVFFVDGESRVHFRGGHPDLGPGILSGGAWYSRAIRREILDEPYLGSSGYLVYEVGYYLDYLFIFTKITESSSSQRSFSTSLLFFNGELETGEGSQITSNQTTIVETNTADRTTTSVDRVIGSGETCILPGLKLPWSYNRVQNSVISPTGRSGSINQDSSRYSQPLLIDNDANQAITIQRQTTERTTTNGSTTSGSSSDLTKYFLVQRQEGGPKLIELNSDPAFAIPTTSNTPIKPEIGSILIPVNAVFPDALINIVQGMSVVVAVQEQNKVAKAIGLISGLTIDGNKVNGISIDVTSVVRTGFDRLATARGTIYSNNGSVLSLVNNGANFIQGAAQPLGQGGYSRYVWQRNTLYLAEVNPSTRPNFSSDRTHYAEVWQLNLAVSPATVTKQPKSVSGPKVPIAPTAENPQVINIAGSYSP